MKKVFFIAVIMFSLFSCSKNETEVYNPKIVFKTDGVLTKEVSYLEIKKDFTPIQISIFDKVFNTDKNYLAIPLSELFNSVYDSSLSDYANINFSALDGYTVSATLSLALENGGYLAIQDLDIQGEENWANGIDSGRETNPAPFYIIWTGADQKPLDENMNGLYPWPYQLSEINIYN